MKLLTLIPLVLAISACTTRDNIKFCETPVRDLTEDWHSRTYWCLPKGYVPLIEPQTTVRSSASSPVSSRVPFDTSVMKSTTPKSEPRALYTEHESLQHKVRVASQESIVSNQSAQANPVVTSQQKEKGIELVESFKKGLNLSKVEQEAILNEMLTRHKKIDPPIGTEPLKKGAKRLSIYDINFTRHNLDTDLVPKELDWTAAVVKSIIEPKRVLKLQGCRKDSEIESLVLGRALAVRKALVAKGVENKIIILTDQECTTDRKVKVFMS